ncbi:MAG: alkaline phosphatase family protein [Candidatus Nanopelagicales bacterium]|nr:alkaline phosphatase family protein [Candidatus Nanopelagicales bacterium]
MTEPVLPAYGSRSLCELLGSVGDGLVVPGFRDVLGLGARDRVAVVVIDGLGLAQLRECAESAPFLAERTAASLTSVFPSTTCAALGSIGTGLTPGRHGLVGASFVYPETGRLLNPLGWGSGPSPIAVQPEPTVLERAEAAGVSVAVVSDRSYRHSGLTVAALRGGQYKGADGPGERAATVIESLDVGGRSLVIGYWGSLDRTAHVHGVASPHYRFELSHVDLLVRQIAASLPAGARLIVTADHGMIDCPDVIDLDADPGFGEHVRLVAGEPRMRHVYARPGAATAVARRWQDLLADKAQVLLGEEAVAEGWFGDVDPGNIERIGSVLAIAGPGTRLGMPSRDSVVSSLLGQHGGLTEAEMVVPLTIID